MIRLLHLSDLQFGRENRCVTQKGGIAGVRGFADSITDDFLALAKEPPRYVVVTGDVTEKGETVEFNLARSFFSCLKDNFGDRCGDKPVILTVPGNHDVHWGATKSCEDIKESCWFDAKFENYNRFQDALNGRGSYRTALGKKYYIHYDRDNDALFIGFNSAVAESHRSTDHYGFISAEQANMAVREMDELDGDRTALRIALMHHNLIRCSNLDEDSVRDADQIKKIFEDGGVDMVLHGHRHQSGADMLVNLTNSSQLAILSTGSTALMKERLPDTLNQYQIIEITPGFSTRVQVARRFLSAQQFNSSGHWRWHPDTTDTKDGKFFFYLHKNKLRRFLDLIMAYDTSNECWVENKSVCFTNGFECHNLYTAALNVAQRRLLVFGRKNRKLFDKDHWRDLRRVLSQRPGGFEFKILFQSPDSSEWVLRQSHKDQDFREQLLNSIKNARDFLTSSGIEINDVARFYRTIRTTPLIIVDDAVIYAHVEYDADGIVKPLTHAHFHVTIANTVLGRGLERLFEDAWTAGDSYAAVAKAV